MKQLAALFVSGFILSGLVVVFVGVTYADPATSLLSTSSGSASEACQGVGLFDSNTGTCGDQGKAANDALATIINFFSVIVGIVAVIMIIVSGLQFMTANGNPQNIAKARSSLMYAIIGLVIVVLAQVIVHFAISQALTAT
jgi:cytochrome bd-type quinol oxidase subunit 2